MKSTASMIALALMFTVPASATPLLSIGYQEAGINGGAITTVASGPSVLSTGVTPYGSFTLNSTSSAFTGTNPTEFGSTTLDVSGSTHGTLTIYVTAQNLTSPLGNDVFTSGFTENILPSGWTVTESTLFSSVNALYTGTLIGSHAFSANGIDVQTFNGNVGAGPFSETEVFKIASTGPGTDLSTIALQAASGAPGPTAATGIPGMMTAMLFGWLLLRRRQIM